MSAHRRQALLDAPLETTWNLVATPSNYPSWWPRVVEVEGETFEEGEEFVQVTRNPRGEARSNFLIERRDELRQIRMSCLLTGMFAEWALTAAQGGTFVELEMGMEPRRLGDRVIDAAVGNRYFRRWSEQSLDALREAASGAEVAG